MTKLTYIKKAVLSAVLFVSTSAYSQVVSTGVPQAMKATTGIGLHKNRIWWVNWDINNNKLPGDNLVNGATTTFTSPAGFVYNITISNVKVYNSAGTQITSGTNYIFNSTRTTSWSGNNMPTAYSGWATSDIIALNQKSELSSAGDGNRVTFTLSVTAKDPYGVSGNATGIVIGGSESLANSSEWYQLSSTGRVRVIDKYIKDVSNWANFNVDLITSNGGKTVRATNLAGGNSRGDVILLAEDVAEINCELKGGGGQSMVIGFLEELDYSDAPASYGSAFHQVENKLNGGILADGTTKINTSTNTADLASSTGQLAKFVDPTLRLGADIDTEDAPTLPAPGANPNIDDTTGNDDEDALPSTTAGVNGYYGIRYVNISPYTSSLSMWIDKDRNGTFDATEKVVKTIPPNNSGTAVIDVSGLNLPLGTNYYTRIRISSKAGLGPTGYAPDGEVEDHFINVVNNVSNIVGTVYFDEDGGIPNGTPMQNVTVELYDSANTLLETTTTDYDGMYIFMAKPNGSYTVKTVLPVATPTYTFSSSTDTTPRDGKTTISVSNGNVTNVDFGLYYSECTKPSPTTTGGLPTKMGITSLGRAGSNAPGNWPMERTGAWTALESKTKGFVINRVSANKEAPNGDGQVPAITNPVKGMIIYDTTNDCLKINTDGTSTGWKCFNKKGCAF